MSVMLKETSGSDHNVSEAKAEEMLGIIEPFGEMLVDIAREKYNNNKYVLFDDASKEDILGYSGGGPRKIVILYNQD
jgi:hypothetical protein